MEGIAASLITNGVLIGGSDVFFLIFLSFFLFFLSVVSVLFGYGFQKVRQLLLMDVMDSPVRVIKQMEQSSVMIFE